MEGRRQLGIARRSRDERALSALRRWNVGAVLFFCALRLSPQATAQAGAHAPSDEQLRQLANGQRWNEIVALLEPVRPRTAEMDYSLGMAQAQLGRLAEARSAFEEGQRLAPRDERFPVELAGVAFKQKNYPVTIRELRRALRLSPGDTYANDFLGTTYFVDSNLDAALKYWNRVGKPQIAEVRAEPPPRLSPPLLDHAFAFSPASTLTLPQLADSEARLRGLGVFPQFQFDLNARDNGRFDVVFRGRERDGLGDGKLEALLLFFQGIPFQEVNPSYYNLRGEAINFTSMVRWDAQKRRIAADFFGPFEQGARDRWQIATDLRNENWAIRNGFTGPAPVLASLNLRDEKVSFDLASHASDRLGWMVGAEVSHRNYRSVEPGTTTAGGRYLTPQMLAAGYELKQQAHVTSTLWCVPERRFTVDAAATSDAGRLWSQPAEGFEKLTGALGWHWFPQIKGDDYETSQQFRAGRTFGQVPFDELFILGLERDNDLPLRAHIGTRDGRKGSAPLGRNYVLENWETNKNIYSNGIFTVQLGPFFDFGKIADPGTALGSHEWLFDTGAQAKLRVLRVGLVFSYGKDLRTGNNAFYLALLP
jgi:tetratricopeptide (TPR) repeat protein